MSEQVRYGVVGTGMMGIEHLRNLAAIPCAVVAAVADPYIPSQEQARLEVDKGWPTERGLEVRTFPAQAFGEDTAIGVQFRNY